MDKTRAQGIIKNVFENKFDKVKFTNFIINLLNVNSKELVKETASDFGGNYIPETFNQYIDSCQLIGKYESDNKLIDILVINLKKETSLDRARTMQRNFAAWYLKHNSDINLKDAAVVAFVSPDSSNWRFSLIKMDYGFEQNEARKVKIKEELTPARRWSFLVGENENSHTAQSQLVDLLADENNKPTLKNLEDAFNIEKVTKEFFKKYTELFNNLKDSLEEVIESNQKVKSDFENKSINPVDFSKKLLGQIVFLYFLQKKGWFGVKKDDSWGTGPKDFLKKLFDKKYIQYDNFFNDVLEPFFYEALRIDRSYDDDYLSLFKCKIPFLNGGLFDPINNYDWVHTDILLPDELFSNSKKTKDGDNGDGILDVFDRYNFTVKEDEPLEKEVAVDPEMLGKVFENLLEVKDRKSKGTYYTPREIVHYMCQQSLVNYLATEMENILSKDEIETFVKYCEQVDGNEISTSVENNLISQNIISNAKLTDDKLADIKVCDPAVGSGAFLIGMMSEIVKTRIALNTFLKDKTKTAYNLKRECIENSLYGVDIDPGAVEIAKLRLWLSLVVDEDDIKQIKPLPNLDYKIVCGNSLLGVEKNLFNQHLFSELEQNKKLLFNEVNPSKKQEYKKKIDELIFEITNGHREFDFEIYFSEVFHGKGGFDIVIANPPYGFRNVLSKDDKEYFRKVRKIEFSSGDISELFVYYSFDKLVCNNGTLTFIIPKKSLYGESWKKLRVFWLKYQLVFLMDASKAFEEVLLEQQSFSLIKKQNNDNMINIGALDNKTEKILFFGSFKLKDIFSNNLDNAQIYRRLYNDIINKIDNLKFQSSKPILKAEIGISNVTKYLTFEKSNNYPCVKGIDISNYCLKKRERFLIYDIAKNYVSLYEKNKVISQKIVAHVQNPVPHIKITAFYDNNKRLIHDTCVWIRTLNERLDEKFLLGYIQSTFCNWYAYNIIYNKAIRTMDFINYYVKQIPFPKKIFDKPELQESVISLVDKIINITDSIDYFEDKEKQNLIEEYRKQIDNLIYIIWELSNKDIYIVLGH
ncbi:MAG: Eco57I restriction-modification methylase domain-containing protein [Candidatus Humimicrobiaceae bacterium]